MNQQARCLLCSSKDVLVLNSKLGGQWLKNAVHRHFPIAPGKETVITVHALPDGFEVSCNRRQFCVKRSYPPGYNAESVYTLSTSGDRGDAGILYGKVTALTCSYKGFWGGKLIGSQFSHTLLHSKSSLLRTFLPTDRHGLSRLPCLQHLPKGRRGLNPPEPSPGIHH